MKKRYPIFPVVIIAMIILVGCSTVRSNSILTSMPSADDPQIASSDYENYDSTALFGAYNLEIHPDFKTADLSPMRTSSIGESYLVNGMRYFNIMPCSTCLTIKQIALDSGKAKITFNITHPFDAGDPSLPPSGKNRLDLNVFDVAMIVVPNALTPSSYSSVEIYPTACVNQAGFTRELQNIIGESAACPYFLVIDDSLTGISTYNKFAMGTHDKTFDTWFSDVGTYKLYLTMAYGSSAKKSTRFSPKYYNPEFNRKAAWKVKAIPPEGTNPPAVGNTWDDFDQTTQYFVTVDVYDWQVGATVNPLLTNTTDIYAKSGVKSVVMEIPGMTSSPSIVTSPMSGTGKPNAPLVYRVPMANANGLPMGEYMGLVQVLDDRTPTNPYTDRDYMIDPKLSTPITNVTPALPTFQAEDVSAKGSYACVASTTAGFKIVDISDPKSAHTRGSLAMSGPTCIDLLDNYAYICDSSSLRIIDISSPDSPSIVKQVTSLNAPRDVTVIGSYAYVATAGGIVIIDVDPPASASVIKGVSTHGAPNRMAVTNGYAYITTSIGSSSFLEIVSVDPPASAYKVSEKALILPAGALFGICVSGYEAFITGQRTFIGYQNELLIVDIDPPETPLVSKIVSLYEVGMSVEVHGRYAYVGGVNYLQVIDISKYDTAHMVTSAKIPDVANNIDIESGYIYIADRNAGLKIYTVYIPPSGGLEFYVIPEYATYQTFTATVVHS